ncbi:MAG: TspO/MBR family protein [Oscillospiraceae bacterium]|nr:TspO/MBR family protein [Oscillospiraceae bacterium]
MKKNKITELLISIILAELVGSLSALFSGSSFSLFRELNKPPFSPPGWIFPVVWTVLYALMGFSAYIIYSSDSKEKSRALVIYGAQLFVNFLWSIVFFRFELLKLSVAVILILLTLVTIMILKFRKISRTAAFLNIPYLIWIMYATWLNIGIAVLND